MSSLHPRPATRRRRQRPALWLLTSAACLFAGPALAIDVASQTDWNAAVAAVAAAGAGTTTTINITSGFALSSSLAQLQANNANVTVNITGNGQTIDGVSAYQGIVVNGAHAPTVNISNLSVANTVALGGNGQTGQSGYLSPTLSYGAGGGGGGGLGAGGGLLVGTFAKVTLASVTFTGNAAIGGNGGNGGVAQNVAPDPNGGNGGAGGGANNGGASGGGGAGGLGGNTGTHGTAGTAGPAIGDGGGGGGGSGTTSSTAYTLNNLGGAGYSGGGSGDAGGDGVTNYNGTDGPGADGGTGGNGGAARGGAIYVAASGSLTILDTGISDASATGGSAGSQGVGQGPASFNGSPGGNGVASGSGIYLDGVAVNIGVSSGTLTYANTIGSSGFSTTTLNKTGAGTLVLSGTNTYTGATAVIAGVLTINGSIASSSGLTVGVGAAIGGNGALPSTTINGTLAPGNSIGVININGNLVLGAGSVYAVEVSPTDADRVNVTGTAQLAGEARLLFQPGSYSSNTYTILTAAGGRSGTFDTVTTTGLPTTLQANLTYTPTNVTLVTLVSQMGSLTGLTHNQRAVGGAQDTAFNSGLTTISGLYNLSPAQLPAALDQLSGEVHVSTAGALADESLYARSAVLGRLRQASYGSDTGLAPLAFGGPNTAFADGSDISDIALAYAKSPMITKAPPLAPTPTSDVAFWAQGFGAWGHFDGDGNAVTLRRDLAGFMSGVDTRVGAAGRAGLAAGYTSSTNALDGRGSATVDSGHIAAYGGWNFGAATVRGGVDYAFHSISTDRTVAFPGFFDRTFANYSGGTGQVFGEIGYGIAFAGIALEPFAGAAFVHVHTDATTERGGPAALNFAGATVETGYSTLGVRAAGLIPFAGMVLTPRGTLAWQHAFNDVTPSAGLSFANSGVGFSIAGVPLARDALLAEAGLDLAINSHASIGVCYTGQIASNVQDHAAKGRFTWKF